MLKLQIPHNLHEYIGVDATRGNEFHSLGFIPEYLYEKTLYFKINSDLINYLENGIKPHKKSPAYESSKVVRKKKVSKKESQ